MKLQTKILNQKKNGNYSVYVICYVRGERCRFLTGVEVPAESFDSVKECLKPNIKGPKEMNLLINETKKRITDILIRYRLSNTEITAEKLRKEFENAHYNSSFYSFYENELNEHKSSISASMFEKYSITLRKMKQFAGELLFCDFDSDFLKRYETHCRKIGNKQNTINSNLKNIKYFARLAYRKKIMQNDIFSDYKIKSVHTIRNYLSHNELIKVIDYHRRGLFTENQQIILTSFLFACFTGLRFSDVVNLTFDNVQENFLVLIPIKTAGTGKQIKIPISAPARQYIDFAVSRKKIFQSFSAQYTNREIKRVFENLGIKKTITFHCARHTFATLYLSETNDIAGLQRLLGHANISETMIYAHIIDNSVVDNMNLFSSRFE